MDRLIDRIRSVSSSPKGSAVAVAGVLSLLCLGLFTALVIRSTGPKEETATLSPEPAALPAATQETTPETEPSTTTTTVPPTTTTTTAPPTTTTTTTTAPPTTQAPKAPDGPSAAPPEGGPSAEAWAALRKCESGGRYDAYNPAGPYYGAYQFNQGTWNGVAQRAGRPDLVGMTPSKASPADQDQLAFQLYAERGAQPWPHCGRYLK